MKNIITNHTQQPEVIACQDEGERVGSFDANRQINPRYLESGKSKEYPPAEVKDPTDNWLELYKEFKLKCWRHGIIDKEEIVLLYNIL